LQAANQVLLLFGPIENPRWPPAGLLLLKIEISSILTKIQFSSYKNVAYLKYILLSNKETTVMQLRNIFYSVVQM
jgi:hypothetical protein